MGAYSGMSQLLGDLVPISKSLNYPESSITVLKGDLRELQEKHPQIYANLLSCRHNRDTRTPLEYGQDLVASWLFEDYLMKNLSDAGLAISGAGADKNREILPNVKVSASSDCEVSYNGKTRGLEIMNDYTGWWKRTHHIDLRDQKYTKIVRTNSLFLGVSNSDNTYVLIEKMAEFPSKFIPSHMPYGYKPAFQLTISNNDLKPLDFSAIATQIKSYLL